MTYWIPLCITAAFWWSKH